MWIDIEAFVEACEEIVKIDRLSSGLAGVGKTRKYSVENSEMLSIACMASAAYNYLIGYLDEKDRAEVERLLKIKFDKQKENK